MGVATSLYLGPHLREFCGFEFSVILPHRTVFFKGVICKMEKTKLHEHLHRCEFCTNGICNVFSLERNYQDHNFFQKYYT